MQLVLNSNSTTKPHPSGRYMLHKEVLRPLNERFYNSRSSIESAPDACSNSTEDEEKDAATPAQHQQQRRQSVLESFEKNQVKTHQHFLCYLSSTIRN